MLARMREHQRRRRVERNAFSDAEMREVPAADRAARLVRDEAQAPKAGGLRMTAAERRRRSEQQAAARKLRVIHYSNLRCRCPGVSSIFGTPKCPLNSARLSRSIVPDRLTTVNS